MRFLPTLCVLSAILMCATSFASDTARLTYPAAKKDAQTDTYHGVQVADPYRWLENLDSAETRTWISAENKLTSGYLDAIPGRDRIKQRLSELWNYERYGAPQKYGERWFYTRNDGLQNQSVLYVADSLDATPRPLLDPNTLSKDGTIALKQWSVSDDGKYVAYGLSSGGSDWEEWHVLDVDAGKPTQDVLKWVKFSNTSWRRDGTGFFYSRYDEPKSDALKAANKFQKLYFHRLGEDQDEDLLIYENAEQPDWRFQAEVSDDGRWLVISVNRSTEPKNLVLYRDLAKPYRQKGEKKVVSQVSAPGPNVRNMQTRKVKSPSVITPVETLIGDWNAAYEFLGNSKGTLYFLTDADAPRYRIVGIDTGNPAKANWKEIVPQGKETLQNARIVNRSFVATYMQDAHSAVRLFDLKGSSLGEIALPGLGAAAGFSGRPRDQVAFYTFSSFTAPTAIYRYDLSAASGGVWRAPKTAFDPSRYETKQVFATSRDGTRVPVFVTSKKNLALDGNNPTILYGYGGFNIPLQPSYSAAVAAWLDLGGVYAVANLRGGGEYGRDWHEAGIKTHKQNVFDDFIAAAEFLVKQKYTAPAKLAIRGGSNGGLLVAATELQRPELFAAAIAQVGVLDMLRFRDFTIGKAWESDYGSVDNADEFKALYAYSPLHNVKPGTDYPATLILTGDHDDRVFPAHSFKFAAAMQAANLQGKPKLIRIETRAGHGQGKPTAMQIDEAADVYAFILSAMGLAR
ncbi:MAG: S9 family peptidase [Rudaea sp.]|uniref:prolyl oligopeptidase family serine peptidase n=2 Tax=Gammaproteobacteria TaxID=1236 RepID=UPI0010F81B53|nr:MULTISPECIES: prolyl oligopeptidase family serine peptidase [unclassified Rudaea]MBN8888020.1 S9 family peptidase [Rudaea sp.]MBR0346508.1 S9 family peptidase [Rudaea sp.]